MGAVEQKRRRFLNYKICDSETQKQNIKICKTIISYETEHTTDHFISRATGGQFAPLLNEKMGQCSFRDETHENGTRTAGDCTRNTPAGILGFRRGKKNESIITWPQDSGH
jgi:hypothetical protein